MGGDPKQGGKTIACERKQLPLELAFAVSIHKGQGMTIGKDEDIEEAVIDLGQTELDLGLSYVGLGRFKALSALKIVMPTWTRFENIGAKRPSDAKYATMQARTAEAQRILGLANATKVRFAAVWQQCVDWAAEVAAAGDGVEAGGDGDRWREASSSSTTSNAAGFYH